MKKILFVTATFRDTGPTQQLLNIITRLDKAEFQPILISLFAPTKEDKSMFFKQLNIETYSLGINKLSAILSIGSLKKLILKLNPHVIHTHGFLPDFLTIASRINIPHVLTARCDPYLDYPTKFGWIIGKIMALVHVSAVRLCPTAIACSESLQQAYKNYGVNARVIRNGVDPNFINNDFEVKSSISKTPTFITSSSLLPRKNVELMISVFSSSKLRNIVNFKVLGDGFLMPQCQQLAGKNISMLGHIDRPYQHLSESQCYISLSKSEGMPNSVIEALMVGLPCILSDIGPHREIYNLMPNYVHLLNYKANAEAIAENISLWLNNLSQFNNHDIRSIAIKNFHADNTAFEYQQIYRNQIRILNV